MSTAVLCVGKMKEKPYREMADEYLKRLSRFGKYEVRNRSEPGKGKRCFPGSGRETG